MRVLLDAHAPLIGAGTLVEIAVKRALKKLPVDEDWPMQTQASGIDVHAISWSHASRLQSLPYVRIAGREHRDPFDRLLAAQALTDRLPIVTCDPALAAYGVATIW